MPKCQPGDLAVVVQADFHYNLGKIVHVVALDDGKGDIAYRKGAGVVWQVQCPTQMKWRQQGRTYLRNAGPVPDSKLQPIRGQSRLRQVLRSSPEEVVA